MPKNDFIDDHMCPMNVGLLDMSTKEERAKALRWLWADVQVLTGESTTAGGQHSAERPHRSNDFTLQKGRLQNAEDPTLQS